MIEVKHYNHKNLSASMERVNFINVYNHVTNKGFGQLIEIVNFGRSQNMPKRFRRRDLIGCWKVKYK